MKLLEGGTFCAVTDPSSLRTSSYIESLYGIVTMNMLTMVSQRQL